MGVGVEEGGVNGGLGFAGWVVREEERGMGFEKVGGFQGIWLYYNPRDGNWVRAGITEQG